MYSNLKNVLYRKNIAIKQYANFLGISEKTAQNKLRGITAFTYPEFKRTCTLLLPEYNADYLFATEEEAVSEAGRKAVGA
jgi:transcriptional regulator with XRE-family HTH domain